MVCNRGLQALHGKVQRLHDRKKMVTFIDGLVKSLFCPIFVIPAKAGIQLIQAVLDSCFRRSDGFSDFLRSHLHSLRRKKYYCDI